MKWTDMVVRVVFIVAVLMLLMKGFEIFHQQDMATISMEAK